MNNYLPCYLLVAAFFGTSCASKRSIGTAQSSLDTALLKQPARNEYLGANDLKRVRNPEFVKSYYVGRKPSKNGQQMHEAHRVYQLEKSPRWNLRRGNPPLKSTGPVQSLRDSAFRPLPPSDQLHAERQRLHELSQDLEQTQMETVEQLILMKDRLAKQSGNADLVKRLSSELRRERALREETEKQFKAIQSLANDNDSTNAISTKQLREWGEQQP